MRRPASRRATPKECEAVEKGWALHASETLLNSYTRRKYASRPRVFRRTESNS